MITKRCNQCRQFKPLSEFSKQYAGKYHVRAICKTCDTISKQERRHTQHTLHAEHHCWHCGVKLDHKRYLRECKRMKREKHQQGGIGERLPRCLDCQIKNY